MADQQTRYSLILASGEAYDLIFTAAWAHYETEAPRGAFHEITMDLVETYMPQTFANQPVIHFDYNRLGDGRVYMVPASFINLTGNANAISIREDLRKELGVPEVTDLASLEVFLDAVATSIPGMFPYAASANNNELRSHLFMTGNNRFPIAGNPVSDFFTFKYTPGMTSQEAAFSVEYVGDTDDYREFAALMKSWADKGYWSRSAIADTTQVRDSYENNQSAMFVQNTGTMGMANNALRDKGFEPLMIDLFPTANRFMGITNAGVAVPARSQNLERALMFLDLLKYDQRVYELYRWGIEGVHWEWVDPELRLWRHGPEQSRYVFGQGSWGFSSPEFEPRHMEGTDPEGLHMFNGWWEDHIQVNNPLAAFVFDLTPIQNEISALNNVRAEHMFLIDLGMVDNVDTALSAMNQAARVAGLDRVIEELTSQLNAWLEKITY
jgi:putative aldouronate transport system substrate-binding protein